MSNSSPNPALPIAGRFLALDTVAHAARPKSARQRCDRDIDEYLAKARAWEVGVEVDTDATALAAVAARAFAAMKISAATQTILFRGDGNVDKHTHLTHLLTHINSLSSKKAHKVHHRILAAQTVLAALGTAATPTCPLVSRFGQYTEIQFDDKHKIVGAKTLEFALDKARVTNVPAEERSFHVFYQLLAGATPEQRQEWRLNPDPAHWTYLASGSKAIEKADADGFGKLLAALKTLGLSKKSQSHVLAVLAAILHLGQIQFVEAKNTETHDVETRVRNPDQVELVATLLGLDASALESSLLQHTGYIGVDKCTVEHSVLQALEAAAKLASTLYALLFTWVTEFINSRLHFDNAHAMIAVAAFPGTQATFEPTPAHPSGSGVWAALANHVDAKVDKFAAEYVHALHAEFAADSSTSPASLSLSIPADPDTRPLRRRFAADLAERMPLDVLALFKSQCTNEFVAGLFALKAVADAAAAKSAHVPAKPLRKSSIKRKSKSGKSAEPEGHTILDELDGAVSELLTDLAETNITFIACGHGHAAAQATLALAGPVLSSGSGLGNYLVRAPLSRMVTRYGGLMTSRGLDESRPMRDRVDSLLRGIGVEDHVLGRDGVWVSWKAVNMMERDLKKFKEWKKAQRGAGGDDATGSQYSAVAPGRAAGGAFDDGASYVSEDETYMSDNASMYDGFSIANGYSSSTKGGAAAAAGASSGAYGYSGLGSRSVMPDTASRAAAADQVEMLPANAKDPTMPRVVEKKKASPSRKRWVCFTWCVTWWIPSFCLSICGRMKDKHVQQAWREKVALCFIIFLLSCVMLFVIGVAGLIICPRKDLYSRRDLEDINSGKSRKLYSVIYGVVYDLNQLTVTLSPTRHSRQALEPYGHRDISAAFLRSPVTTCPGLNIDKTIRFDEKNANRTTSAAEGFATSHVNDKNIARVNGILGSKQFRQGFLAITEEEVREAWLWEENSREMRFIVNNVVYDLTSYFANQGPITDRKQDFLNFLPADAAPTQVSLPQYIKEKASTGLVDFSNDERFMRIWNSPDKRIKDCIQALYTYAVVDDRNTWKCRYADYILLAMSIVLCCIILFKFLAALQLRGGTETPEKMDKFVMIQVPCYTEDELSMSRTINSIAALKYDDKRKLMIVIADGLIVGKGNDRPTSRIVLDILGVDPNLDPEPLSYQAIGEGTKQHNMAKVYSGLYEYEGHLVPYIVLVKVGKESESQRPGNRGKRDSQMMLMRFLNHLHYEKPMSPLELEMRHHITHVIGVDPKWYEYCLMIDADTTVHEESLTQLVAYSMTDTEIIGLCGETRLMNEKSTMTTMIQVYEYFISHHLSKSFESLFSSVTCLPGCFCMYRIVSANKGKPLLCHDTIIEEYSDIRVHTLHKKNLLHLGEDRYLTTLILKNFPAMKTKFTPAAIAYTFAPESFSVLLSQRRRWINSTFHNLFELIWVKGMCGFCCFSMRFIVFIDLIATIIQPATVLYLGYLIYLTVNAIVKEQSLNLVMISLILIAAMYGLQAIIFILKSAFDMIVWMLIYILAMPVFSFFIPIYSFWRFDDFSWGNTRVIVGDKGQKQLIREEDEYFDVSMIKHMKWDEYQAEVMETQSQVSRMTDLERERELREMRELQLAAAAGSGGSVRGGGSRPGSVHGAGGRPMSIASMQSLTQQQYMLAPAAAAGGFGGMPTDAELAHEIRRILMSSDLMRITKKQVREELSALFGMDLTPRKDFINGTIDAILRENM